MDLMTVIQSFWNEMVPHLVGMIGQNFRLWSYWSCKNGHALLLTSLDKCQCLVSLNTVDIYRVLPNRGATVHVERITAEHSL